MTKAELAVKLAKSGVPDAAYSLSGGLPNEAYCLEHSAGKWYFYYSERGLKSGLKVFGSEQEACDYFFVTIKRDLGLA